MVKRYTPYKPNLHTLLEKENYVETILKEDKSGEYVLYSDYYNQKCVAEAYTNVHSNNAIIIKNLEKNSYDLELKYLELLDSYRDLLDKYESFIKLKGKD